MKGITRLLIFPFFVLLASINTKAQYQFYLVNDKDGFVNVRETAGADGKIICQLNNGMIVSGYFDYEDPSKKNWVTVEFYLPKDETGKVKSKPEEGVPVAKTMTGYLLYSGYIYQDRLINIEEQKGLRKKSSDDYFLLYNDSIKIKFSSASFQKEKHKILKKEGFVTKIDGHFFAGTDGDIPRYEIKSFSIEINHRKVGIPRSCFYDLYEPNLNDFTNAYIDQNGILYIIMTNSDGAGSYDVIFVIKDNKYFTRYVFDGGC